MMNEYSAISPSMNDQWSGKTLFSARRSGLAPVSRSSAQLAARPVLVALVIVRTLPEGRADGLAEIALGYKVPFLVHVDVEQREGTRRGPEDRLGVPRHVELRLVARAQDVVGLVLVQRDRAADVRADLRERHVRAEHDALAVGVSRL